MLIIQHWLMHSEIKIRLSDLILLSCYFLGKNVNSTHNQTKK